MPHDVVASEDKTVFVGDVHARVVWKFASTESMFFLFLMSQLHILYLQISTTYVDCWPRTWWLKDNDLSTLQALPAEVVCCRSVFINRPFLSIAACAVKES